MKLVTPEKFKGKDAFYERMIGLLLKDLPETWASFEEAMADTETTKKFVHKIKGTAGNLDLLDVYQCASHFEGSMRDGMPSKDLYEMFVKACEDLKAAAAG